MSMNLSDAASHYLASLPAAEAVAGRQVILQFVRWFGRERPMDGLTAHEIANYAQRLSSSATDYGNKLDIMRAFLAYARKKGWTKNNLALHFKARKGKSKPAAGAERGLPKPVSLTRQGYDKIEEELESLKAKRPQVITDIRKAAADKDFRENAPLDAAREQLGHIDGRIKELEEALKSATVMDGKTEVSTRAGVGSSIVLTDLASDEQLSYTIVSPREVDPARGRISSASPIGKAIIGKGPGDVIEISVPAGRLRYRIEQVGR